MKKKITLKDILFLQAIIMIFSASSVVAKLASGQALLSVNWILFYGLEIFLLGVYAIFWQQAIKKFDLSIAYANRAMVLLWSIVWAVLIFKEKITVQNIIGLVVVILGIVIINAEEQGEDNEI